jgi:hypothetical protein
LTDVVRVMQRKEGQFIRQSETALFVVVVVIESP